jgi:hypothetical protein
MQGRAIVFRNCSAGTLDLCIVPRVLRADNQGCQTGVLSAFRMIRPKSERRGDLSDCLIHIAALQFDDDVDARRFRDDPIRSSTPNDQTSVDPNFTHLDLLRIEEHGPAWRPIVVHPDASMRASLGTVGQLTLRRQTRSPGGARTDWKWIRTPCPDSRH